MAIAAAAAEAGGGGAGDSAGLGLSVERLRAGGHRRGTRDLFSLLVSLSRGVDYALSRNEVPKIAKELPSVVRMVYQKKDDTYLISAIMNACRCGWFNDTEVGEFNELAKELYNCFSSGRGDFTVESTLVPDVVSEIMPRFFPHLELGKILVSIEAKPGYEVLMADFLISKSFPPSSNEKILLGQWERSGKWNSWFDDP